MATDANTLKPTQMFRDLIEIHGGVYGACQAWKVEYRSLERFLKGTGGLAGDTIAKIIEAARLPFDKLFTTI